MSGRNLAILFIVGECLLAFHPSIHAEETFRMWTDASNRQVEASFGGLDGDSVKLKLRNGSIIPYPLNKLSPADQEWVKQQGASATAPSATPSKPSPSTTASSGPAKAWPRSTGLEEAPKATVVKEDAAAKEFIYRTPNFEFQCDSKLGSDVVREFGRIFEGTLVVNKELPLEIDPKPENGRELFVAKLYTKKEDYLADGGLVGSAGVYSGGAKAIKVPLVSLGVKLVGKRYALEPREDNDTLIHEITHQMMNHWLGKLPVWYTEGSAMYVASSKFNMGRFTLPKLGQTVKNLEHLRQGKATIWHLDYLMHITHAKWAAGFGKSADGDGHRNYTSAVALTYYLYHGDDKDDGAHMVAFMKDIAGGKKWEEAQNDNIIRGRSYAQMEKELTATLRKGGITVEFADGPASSSSAAN